MGRERAPPCSVIKIMCNLFIVCRIKRRAGDRKAGPPAPRGLWPDGPLPVGYGVRKDGQRLDGKVYTHVDPLVMRDILEKTFPREG